MAGFVLTDASPLIGLARVDGLQWLQPRSPHKRYTPEWLQMWVGARQNAAITIKDKAIN